MDGILVSLGPGAGRDDGQDEAKPSAPPSRRKSEYPEPESDEDLLIEEDDAPPAKAPPPPAPLTGAAHNPEVEAARVLLRKGLRALLAVEGADDRQLGELRRCGVGPEGVHSIYIPLCAPKHAPSPPASRTSLSLSLFLPLPIPPSPPPPKARGPRGLRRGPGMHCPQGTALARLRAAGGLRPTGARGKPYL